MDKVSKFAEKKDEEFNKIIIEDDNNLDMKISYPESINNGFNFTVNKKIFEII